MRPVHVLVLALLASSGCIHVSEYDQVVPVSESFDQVFVDLGSGDVGILTGGDSLVGSALVSETIEWSGGEMPVPDVYVEGGVLNIISRCDEFHWWGICSVDIEVSVPVGVSVEVRTGSGDVAVADMTDAVVETGSGDVDLGCIAGTVWAETGSGDVYLNDVGGDAFIETGSGDVEGFGLAGMVVDARTGSGDIELAVESAFEAVILDTGSGDVGLEVPTGAYDMELETGSGDIEATEVMDDPGAAASITVHTGSGDIDVMGR